MDRTYVIENQIVDRYLRDELAEDERAAFEEFYLSDQETLAELELAEKLQLGLKECAERGMLVPAARQGWFRRAVTSPQWAAAASVLLLCSLALSGVLYSRLQTGPSVTGTQLVPLYTTRGADAARVPVADEGNWIVLLVDPGFEPYDEYRANIIDGATGVVVWQVGGLQPGYEELLPVGVAGSVLRPGRYELRVEARSGSGAFAEISRIPLQVP